MQGVCSQIMGIRPSLLVLSKNATMPDGTRVRYPPTFFVQMARDVAMADWIALDADKLKSQASHAWHPSLQSMAHAVMAAMAAIMSGLQQQLSVTRRSAVLSSLWHTADSSRQYLDERQLILYNERRW